MPHYKRVYAYIFYNTSLYANARRRVRHNRVIYWRFAMAAAARRPRPGITGTGGTGTAGDTNDDLL